MLKLKRIFYHKIVILFNLLVIIFFQSCLNPPNNMGDIRKQKTLGVEDLNNQAPLCPTDMLILFAKKNSSSYELGNFYSCDDPNGDLVYYKIKKAPHYGTLSNCAGLNVQVVTNPIDNFISRNCHYTPYTDFEGSDDFTVVATDGIDESEIMTVSIDVASNHSPSWDDQTLTFLEGDSSVQTLNPISPPSDPDFSDELSYSLVSLPTYGTLSSCLGLNGSSLTDLSCKYQTSKWVQDSFTVKVEDPDASSDMATITLKNIDSALPTSVSGFSTYVKMNGGAQPLYVDAALTTPKVLTATTDPYGDVLTYTLLTAPTKGSLLSCLDQSGADIPAPDLTCQYRPNLNIRGTDQFVYKISDSDANSVAVSVTVVIKNNLPTINQTSFNVFEDSIANIIDPLVLDIDGDLRKVVGTSPLDKNGIFDGTLAHGKIENCLGLPGSSGIDDSICEYTPALSYFGSDSFSIRVTNWQGDYVDATLSITIDSIIHNPIFENQSANVMKNAGAQLISFNMATSIDVASTAISYTVLVSPVKGTLSSCFLRDDFLYLISCYYTPNLNQIGSDSFTVQALASNGGLATASMNVNILSNNRKPYFSGYQKLPFTITVPENYDGLQPATLENIPHASDPNVGDVLTYSLARSPQGTLSACDSSYDCNYLPPLGLNGTKVDTYTVRATDGEGLYADLVVNVNITKNNFNPSFVSATQQIHVEESTAQPKPLLSSLEAATDPDPNDVLSYSLKNKPGKGTLFNCLGLNGSSASDLDCDYVAVYSYWALYLGNGAVYDSFSYQVSDGEGGIASSYVEIILNPINFNPVISILNNNQKSGKGSPIQFVLKLDEGGSISENTQSLSMQLSSSDPILLPVTNVNVLVGADIESASRLLNTDFSFIQPLGDNATDISDDRVWINLTPSLAGASASEVTITITVSDDLGASSQSLAKVTIDNGIVLSHGGWTKVFANGPTVKKDGTYAKGSNDAKLIFSWAAPSLSGTSSTVSGYNIFRSTMGPEDYNFDYSTPLNTSLISDLSYQDTSTAVLLDISTSRTKGKVLWYRIVPTFSDGLSGWASNSTDRTLEALIPPNNKILVHRWMANKIMCDKTSEVADRINNYRCEYYGPGNIADAGAYYYDIQQSFFMDRFEVGCPYSVDACDFYDASGDLLSADTDCVTQGYMITNNVAKSRVSGTTVSETVFYDRSNGSCYYWTGGTGSNDTATWSDMNTSAMVPVNNENLIDYPNMPSLPPLTNITKARASLLCSDNTTKLSILYNNGNIYKANLAGSLPSRKEYLVSALWDSSSLNNSIENIESGMNLNMNGSTQGCNTFDGYGLSYTIEGGNTDTLASDGSTGTRVLLSGSSATSACSSMFGGQDLVGNISEWATDTITCLASDKCIGAASANFLINKNAPETYYFDNSIGFCDLDTDGTCSSFDDLLIFGDLPNNSKIFYPMGYPVKATPVDIPSANRPINVSFSEQHYNENFIDADGINIDTTLGVMINGGSFKSTRGASSNGGGGAGPFNFEFLPESTRSRDIGFRCINFIN